MDPGHDVRSLLAELDAQQERLRELLAGRETALLMRRPQSGKWSVVENVQHLLFAEREHLGRLDPGGRDWTEFGLAEVFPRSLKQVRLGNDDGGPIDALVDAWRAAHFALVPFLAEQDSPDFRHRLGGHTRHLRTHVKEIERLLRGGR